MDNGTRRTEKVAARNERQDIVLGEVAKSLGLAQDLKVELVTRGDCCQAEIRIRDGEAVKFVKFEIEDINETWDWTSQIAAALTGLAQERGALSTSEELSFERVNDVVWNFSKTAALNLSEFDDDAVLVTDDEMPEGTVITTIRIPDSIPEWKTLIERLAKRALWC